MQTSIALDLCIVYAVVRITKESLGVDEIVIWTGVARCFVVLVDGLLAKH